MSEQKDAKASETAAPKGDELALCKDQLIRLSADFDNYKKRVARDGADSAIRVKRDILLKILSIADTFELALLSLKSASPEVLKGFLMLQSQVKAMIAEEGATEFGKVGDSFDPFLHDAVGFVEGGQDGTIAEIIQKGYKFNGTVLRHATVKVNKSVGQEKKEEKKKEGDAK